MLFRARNPHPRLAPFVQAIWLYDGDPRPHRLERVLPTGTAQLIVNLDEDQTRTYDPGRIERCQTFPGTMLSGVHTRYSIIDTAEQRSVLGVSFLPGGLAPFFGVPSSRLADVHVSVEALWGRSSAARLRERILEGPTAGAKFDAVEDELLAFAPPAGLHPAVAFALATFGREPGTVSVARVTNAIGLSPKRFIERFKAEVGVTPKAFCRVRRFQRALGAAHAGRHVDWSEVALACGYFDQAHFIHDFRAFSGLTPTRYRTFRTEHQNHVQHIVSEESDGRNHQS